MKNDEIRQRIGRKKEKRPQEMYQNGILTTCCLKNCHLREAIIMTSLTRNDWQSERIKTKLKFQTFQTKLIEIKSRNSTFLSSGTSF